MKYCLSKVVKICLRLHKYTRFVPKYVLQVLRLAAKSYRYNKCKIKSKIL